MNAAHSQEHARDPRPLHCRDETITDAAIRMITSAELRASALSTCLSNEPRFASPHTAYLQRDRDRQRAIRQQVVRLDDCLEVEVRDDFVLAGRRHGREQLRDAQDLMLRHAMTNATG